MCCHASAFTRRKRRSAILVPAELGVTGVVHLVGAKPTPAHELDGDLAFPVGPDGGRLELVEFLAVEPALVTLPESSSRTVVGIAEGPV